MSAAPAYAPAAATLGRARATGLRGESWRLRSLAVLGFSTLALLASINFAALLAHPSFARTAGIVLCAAALAGALPAGAALPRAPRTALLAVLTLAALFASFCCAGIAAAELVPWHWGLLGHELARGVDGLDGLWPYRGASPAARAAVMACIPAGVIPAAALVFWPGTRAGTRRRLAALALLLALYVTGAVNQPRGEWQVQGLLALGALFLWGWASRTRRAEDGRAAAWLLAGTLAALILAGTLAGRGLIDVRSWQPFGQPGADTAFNWNQTYGPLPWPSSSAEMVAVSSPAPQRWRAIELDRFDGTGFLASGDPPGEPAGLAEAPRDRRWITTATFLVKGLRSELLLSPGQILDAVTAGPDLPAPAPDGTLALTSPTPEGVSYRVTAYAPQPTALELRRSAGPLPPAFAPYVEFGLPSPAGPGVQVSASSAAGIGRIEASPYAGVYALARRLAAGVPDDYDLAARIERFLRRGFIYDTDPPAARYPIVSFLLGDRRGYCQQFSAAMALMLRMDGVPARVAAGFEPGLRSSAGGVFVVSALDAHAWVEVFFSGIGWVPFDPTPEGPSPAGAGRGATLPSLPALAAGARGRAPHPRALTRRRGPVGAARARAEAGTASATLIATGAAVALLALALGLGALRRRRRRTPADTTGGADAELAELTRALRRLGLEPEPGTTLAELERRLARSHGSQAGEYLRSLRELRYGRPGTARTPSARERRLLRRALSTGGALARLRGLLALPPAGRG